MASRFIETETTFVPLFNQLNFIAMDIFTNAVPVWVSALFLVSMFVPAVSIANIIKNTSVKIGMDTAQTNRNRNGVLVFYSLFFMYAITLSITGFLSVNTLPPRVLLFTTLPLIIFYFGVVFRSKIFWIFLKQIPLATLIRIHIFRFVGVFFLIAYFYGALPKTFALIAGFGDIFTAFTAIFVAYWAEYKKPKYKIIVLIWNIIGFWDIISVLVTALLVTKNAIEFQSSQDVSTIASNPFVLIPAFAPATIIFLHIAIFKKLNQSETQ